MPVTMYCWRCRMDIPMLSENEWSRIEAILRTESDPAKALRAYQEITGFQESNPNALWHHRINLYGPPCDACGKPLRTEHAKFCAACGASRKALPGAVNCKANSNP